MLKAKFYLIGFMLFAALGAESARAGIMELSFGFGYNRQNYSQGNYAQTTRYSVGVAYHFNALSGVEWSFQQVTDRTFIKDLQNTTFNDRIYSLNWVQSFTGKEARFQPYVKLGAGQLNRDATGSYGTTGGKPPPLVDSLTILLGAGARLYITNAVAFKVEAVSYLQGFEIRTWNDNLGITLGTSFYF